MDAGKPLTPTTQRLFLALWPDDGVRSQLAAHVDQWQWPAGCTRYAPEDWHVTLHFIGDVTTDKRAAIAAGAAVPFQPFDLALDQPRLWARELAVLCASDVPVALKSLQERLGQALRAPELALLPDTRPYMPHLTLARHAGAARVPSASAPVQWRVQGYALVVSTGRRTPRYEVIQSYH